MAGDEETEIEERVELRMPNLVLGCVGVRAPLEVVRQHERIWGR